jgi:hypothetical protein
MASSCTAWPKVEVSPIRREKWYADAGKNRIPGLLAGSRLPDQEQYADAMPDQNKPPVTNLFTSLVGSDHQAPDPGLRLLSRWKSI